MKILCLLPIVLKTINKALTRDAARLAKQKGGRDVGLVEMCKNTNYLSRNLIRGVLCPVFGAFVQLAVYRVVVMV